MSDSVSLFEECGPQQWIGYDESTEKYYVFPSAIKYLMTLTRPLAIISVVGLYRTGKSYLLNRILDAPKDQCFKVSPTVKSCTKGLWLMAPVLHRENYDILVTDTEGLGSLSATATHDSRVFSLALLLSSTFLYNSCGAINETSLNNMSLVSSIASHIHLTTGKDTSNEDLSSCFPKFIWVARDFSLQIVDDNGLPTDATTYFNNALKVAPNCDPAESKNKVRVAINNLFPPEKRRCVCMVRPCTDEGKLQVLPQLPDSELRPEFLESLKVLKETIFEQCTPMTIPGQEGMLMNGPLLATLCQTYVDAMNSNKVPVIRDSWSMLSETECARVSEETRKRWRKESKAIDEALSVPKTKEALETIAAAMLAHYDSCAVGASAQSTRETLEEEMRSGIQTLVESARLRSKDRMRGRLQELERKAIREAATVGDLIQLFENAVDADEPHMWYEEAFPSLVRAIETFTGRMERKTIELQRKVDASDFEIAKVRSEARAETQQVQEERDQAIKNHRFVSDLFDNTEREHNGTKQALEDAQNRLLKQKEETGRTIEELRKQLEDAEKQALSSEEGVVGDQAVVDDYARKISTMATQMIERESELEHSRQRCGEMERQRRSQEDEAASLLKELNLLIPLKTENEEFKTKIYELESALKTASQRNDDMESQHEEESANVQKQAMETVQAIRGVLQQERERSKKTIDERNATLAELKQSAACRAKELEDRAERAEDLSRQRQRAMEEAARQSKKDKDGLKDEIERYAALFKEQQESSNESRKEWMQQLQTTQRLANNKERELHAEKETVRRQMEDARRTLEMELTTTKTNLQATERRRKAIEEEMIKIRDKLGKTESSAGVVIRLQAELSNVREQKEQAQNNARTLSARVDMLEKKVKDIRRATDMEKTTISMQYERQISILESKVLQMQ
jgi:hypothetical protein